jgi:hypothetical protein
VEETKLVFDEATRALYYDDFLVANINPFKAEIIRELIRRYNAHAALRLVYDEVQRLRGMGHIYTTRVVEALDTCEVVLKGENDDNTKRSG